MTPKTIYVDGLTFTRPQDLYAPMKIPEDLGTDAEHPLKLSAKGRFMGVTRRIFLRCMKK